MVIRHILAAATPAAIAMSLAGAGSASAAAIATLPCVPTFVGLTEPSVPIQGAGFTPGGAVTIVYTHPKKAGPESAKVVTADAMGGFKDVAYPASYTNSKTQDQTFTIVATDNAGVTATASLRQVRAGFNISPNPSKPTSRVTYTARGWEAGKNVYAHFRFRGKTYRDIKIAKAAGPCGIASRKMRALPTRPRYGTWTVFIDQKATYSRKTKPQARDSFVIFRRFV